MQLSLDEIRPYLRLGPAAPSAALVARVNELLDEAPIRPAGRWLRDGDRYLLCGTIGAAFDTWQRCISVLSATDALIAQAIGTAAVEKQMDALEAEIRRDLRFTAVLSPRRSPGYGDLPLDFSRTILARLEAGKHLGVSVTESGLLVPTKSVTAICALRPLVLDGGSGTMFQAAGLPPGKDPTDWNLENPAAVTAVHRAYVAAGAHVVLTNTFGANRLKYHGPHALADLIPAAIANARASGAAVALDIGPTGRLLKPAGDLEFEAAYEAFAEEVRLGKGADLIVIETMGDLLEVKAAVLAAKENADLPVFVTVALQENGQLLTGASPEAVGALLESLGVDAYGFNCGLGPERMRPFVERLAAHATKPLIVKPNAGMPRLENGQTVFPMGPVEFAAAVRELMKTGASLVGGCCGTTPEHVARLTAGALALPSCAAVEPRTVVSSGTEVVELRPFAGLVIGERINPTGKKLLKEAYRQGDVAYVLREAVKQTGDGAVILDVNCGVPGIDEAATLTATVKAVQSVVTCPIQIDTADPVALEGALRQVNGKPLVNSVNAKAESMAAVFPLVKKYGGTIVALCLDEQGIPSTVEGRLQLARRILAEGAKFGLGKEDFVFDALTLAVSADPQAARLTLETVKRLTEKMGVNTVLGVSNVSFGLPNRPALNNTMFALAKRAGLSAAIANPSLIRDEIDPAAEDVLLGRDPNCARWIALQAKTDGAAAAKTPSAVSSSVSLTEAIKRGLKTDARSAAEALLAQGRTAMEVIQTAVVPALEEVGCGFEKGTLYLPQLLMAADAAGAAFEAVKAAMKAKPEGEGGAEAPIVLATVKGDIHDIGKNIVRALLENYGFSVVDLGRDVPPEKIVETVRRTGAFLVGLSALMTTTVGAMAETIRQLKAACLPCRTCVGGAVVTQEYADGIGADFYAKDAMRTVRIAEGLVKQAKGVCE